MFPFTSFDHREIDSFALTVQTLSHIHDHIDRDRRSTITLEATAFTFRYLSKQCEFEGTVFVDCMGKRAESCLYAAVFGIEESLSIEMYQPYVERAELLKKAFCPDDKVIHVKYGTFHDYFRYDATIIYLNCTELISSADYLDEGPTIASFLEMCSKTLPGTSCIIVSYNEDLHLQRDFDCNLVEIVYKSAICRHSPDECTVYVCRVLSAMSFPDPTTAAAAAAAAVAAAELEAEEDARLALRMGTPTPSSTRATRQGSFFRQSTGLASPARTQRRQRSFFGQSSSGVGSPGKERK